VNAAENATASSAMVVSTLIALKLTALFLSPLLGECIPSVRVACGGHQGRAHLAGMPKRVAFALRCVERQDMSTARILFNRHGRGRSEKPNVAEDESSIDSAPASACRFETRSIRGWTIMSSAPLTPADRSRIEATYRFKSCRR
jgi:hypothetical protein